MTHLSFYKKALALTSLMIVLLSSRAAIVYQYGFENECGNLCTFASPWAGVPDVLATGLSNSAWATDYSGGFISYSGSCGTTACQSLAISHDNYPASTTYTLTFTVTAGYTLNITGMSYWDRVSATGPTNTTITINGTTAFNNIALQGLTGANTGLMAVTANNLTGTVTIIMTLTGATAATGTFRLDDFVIDGTVTSTSTTPTVFNVTGGGSYCVGGTGVLVGVAGSETGVTYQLQLGGVNVGSPVSGTDSAISFGLQTAAGTYTVIATNTASSLTATMGGIAFIAINPLPLVNQRPLSRQCGGTDTLDAGNPGNHFVWSNNDTTQKIIVSTGAIYSVTVTTLGGCTASWQDSVGIDGTPPTTVIQVSSATICAGSSTTLSVATGIGFKWSNGDTSSVIQVAPLSSGVYSVTVTVASYPGCTSTGSTNITVGTVVTSTVNAQVCPGGSYYGHTSAGTYVDTIQTSGGCDSIRTLNLTLGSVVTTTDVQNICSGQTYGGHGASGVFVDTFASAGGCDSIRTLTLTVYNTVSSNVSPVICFGQSYLGHSASATFTDTLNTIHGCDSLVIVNLTVLGSIASSSAQTICPGQSYGGHNSTGVFVDTLQSSQGCDSVVTLNLTVSSVININSTQTICAGQSYGGHGATGNYIDTLHSAGGCDSIVALNLTVRPAINVNSTQVICAGQIYGGHSTTGVFSDTLQSALGCDSIVTLNLTVNPVYMDSSFKSICHGHSYQGHTVTGIYIDTLSSVSGCDSFSILHLTVHSLPYVSLYLPFDSTCLSTAPFALSGGTPAGGYYRGTGVSSGNFNPAIAGAGKDTVVYVYTDSNNCTRAWYQFMYVDSCIGVGINGVSNSDFNVWPNPTTGVLNMQLPANGEKYEYRVYDMIGQAAISGTIPANAQTTLDLHELQAGIYLLVLINDKAIVYSKEIVRE